MDNKRKQSYPIIYRPNIFVKLITLLIAGFVLSVHTVIIGGGLFLLLLARVPFSELTWNALGGMVVFVLWFYFLIQEWFALVENIFFLSIEVTPQGLLVTYFGRRFYSWDSLKRLGTLSGLFRRTLWGIHAEQGRTIQEYRFAWLVNGINRYRTFIPNVAGIPITPITDKKLTRFRKSEFGQILYEHAPHLFKDVEKSTKHKLADSHQEDKTHLYEDSQLSDKQYGLSQAQA